MRLTERDVRRLGFRPDKTWEHRTGPRPNWFGLGHVRVVLDEDGVDVFSFVETEEHRGEQARKHGLLNWQAHFDTAVPREVVLAALHRAVNLSGDE